MSERGSCHTFKPTWSEADKANPGKRITKTSPNWNWRFTYAGRRYSGGRGPDGHQYRSRTEARDAGEARLAEVRQGFECDPKKAVWVTLEGIIRAHCAGEVQSSVVSMEAIVSRLRSFFGHDRLRDMDDTRLLQYRDHQLAPGGKTETEGYQPATVKLDLAYLRRGLQIAFRKRLILELPAMPKVRKTRRKIQIRPDELDRLLAGMGEHWRRYFLIADEMGWRCRSELRTRRWSDVSFSGELVHLDASDSKTREARVFPFTARLRALLLDQREWVTAIEKRTGRIVPWVCPRDDGRQLGSHSTVWGSACRRAGYGKLEGRTGPWSNAKVAHDIRRTVQNRWEEMGVRSGSRQAMAGHSSDSTFSDYYRSATLEDLKLAAGKIDAAREAEETKVVAITAGKKD